jgi:hypothetical protein
VSGQLTALGDPLGLAAPSVGLAAPSVGLAAPSVGLAAPSVGLAAPSVGLAAPSVGPAPVDVALGLPLVPGEPVALGPPHATATMLRTTSSVMGRPNRLVIVPPL